MKILILTQYFPPEVGAPQNRLYELAIRLQKMGCDIDIHTAMPNYPAMQIDEDYKNKFFIKELYTTLTVYRSWIYVSKSRSILSRLLNYFSFVFSSIMNSNKLPKTYDYILCESPPLFLGISALYYRYFKNAKLIFNVSDLWPESALKLGVITNKYLISLGTCLEEYCYKKSFLITGQTQGICDNIKKRFQEKKVFWLKNGIDLTFFEKEVISKKSDFGFNENDFVITYAGIIGIAQGLEIIINAAIRLRSIPNLKFWIVGDGPEKDKLKMLATNYQLENIIFTNSQPKSKIHEIIIHSNAAIIPLKKLDLFLGAIPSKIFEWLLCKKPILLGVDGEARQLFITEAKAGYYFEPENTDDLVLQINNLLNEKNYNQIGQNASSFVIKHFNRDIIAKELYSILAAS